MTDPVETPDAPEESDGTEDETARTQLSDEPVEVNVNVVVGQGADVEPEEE